MKAIIKVKKEVEIKTLEVFANVRYWEDATVNGEKDTENRDLIPCKKSKIWNPKIEVDTGKIVNWEQGKTAEVHYKVVDEGSYYLKDVDGNILLKIEEDYAPETLAINDSGYGDYIIMKIDEEGIIKDFKLDISDFYSEENE